jgi:hypothetical protein
MGPASGSDDALISRSSSSDTVSAAASIPQNQDGASMTATTIASADAALLGWLGYAQRCDMSDDDCVAGFLRSGHALFGTGYAVGESNLRAAAAWRRLAGRGVSLIGPAFDPTDTIKVWTDRRAARRDELGCRLHAGDTAAPAPVRRTGSPAWREWKRDASAWARDEDDRLAAAQARFAAERVRLGLEALWAQSTSRIDQRPAAQARRRRSPVPSSSRRDHPPRLRDARRRSGRSPH